MVPIVILVPIYLGLPYVRVSYTGHVLFLRPCPGAAFPEYGFCPGFPRFVTTIDFFTIFQCYIL